MSQEIIIDGHNFIGCNFKEFPNIDYNRKGTREDLLKLLSKYAKTKDVTITVVFDNRTNYENIYGDTSHYGDIKVIYARVGQEADDVILSLIRKSTNKRGLIVVSSDRKDIGIIAGAEGCIVKNSIEFMKIIRKTVSRKE